MSDLVRIRVKNSTRYYRKPNHGTTEDKALSHLYERAEAERIVAMSSERAELEPVAPSPACRCAELAKALQAQPCKCRSRALEVCPQCQGELVSTGSGPGWMNSDQWDATKAGDFYCPQCVGEPGVGNGKKYWDKRDLARETISTCSRCAALAGSPAILAAHDAAKDAEIERLRGALQGLVDRLELVHADPRYMSVWTLYAIHGGRYTEPTYTDALTAAKAALEGGRA